MTENAILSYNGKTIELPIITGTLNETAIDITKLRDKTGLITYDPGLGNTGACQSKVCFIDGDKGILKYRGIPIEQFAQTPNFIEVAMLLIYGKQPTAAEYERFSERLTRHAHLHEGMRYHFAGFPPTSHPMAVLSAMINVLACYHPEYLALDGDEHFDELAASLISKIRTIAAYCYRNEKGLPFVYADPSLKYCANFMHMMFSMPYQQLFLDADIEEALNLIFILHADHEQNCSTSTVRVVGSAKANLFTSLGAGVSALWGPLHGGANVEVLEMLGRIHAGGMTAEQCIAKAKDKTDPFKLFGFGHRVYKNFDPRAKMLKVAAERVFKTLKVSDPLLDIARKLEDAALQDPYFIERKLYPNVDFYSGIILRALGIPTDMFTVMFAIGRLPGWIAHWREQHQEVGGRITRPRQIYQGVPQADFVPFGQR